MVKVKVFIKLFTSEQFWGWVFLKDDERVQDLLNDDRKFIPFEKVHMERGPKSEVQTTTIVVSKDAIASIEENIK